MKFQILDSINLAPLLLLLVLLCRGHVEAAPDLDIDGVVQNLKVALSGFKDVLREKSEALSKLTTQAIMLNQRHEDRIRAEGASGIVQVRNFVEGSRNYHASSVTSDSMASFHDHGSSRRVLGMGEAVVVMNGVEFRTRHSDYAMNRPSTTSTGFLATEAIATPPVPPSVTQKATIAAQEQEMREYFRAFQAQDPSHRDYRPYFKAVLCYLEAAWMDKQSDDSMEDWFTTGRSYLGGFTWEELHDRYLAESSSGTKSFRERTAHLPTTILGIDDVTGNPHYAQWNYRPLCFPVSSDIPNQYFKEIDHMAYRIPRGMTKNETLYKRGAHFTLDEQSTNGYRQKTLLQDIISTIPGMDNVPSAQHVFPPMDDRPAKDVKTGKVINLAFYNHWYDIGYHNGIRNVPRGFSDPNLYVALTNQSKVSKLTFKHCSRRTTCGKESARMSYLLPLEVVYLTPLLSWNPFGFRDFQDNDSAVWKGGRSGSSSNKAYHGVSDNFLYQTPTTFFTELAAEPQPADSRKLKVWVNDSQGVPRNVVASGLRTILPRIEGVGQVRLRYPIVPVHGMGSAVWKELEAFKDSWKASRTN